jgi:hypothetical protein
VLIKMQGGETELGALGLGDTAVTLPQLGLYLAGFLVHKVAVLAVAGGGWAGEGGKEGKCVSARAGMCVVYAPVHGRAEREPHMLTAQFRNIKLWRVDASPTAPPNTETMLCMLCSAALPVPTMELKKVQNPSASPQASSEHRG